MSHRIAIATSDGIVINQHFGHADRFLIVDVDDQEHRLVETRLVKPACSGFEHEETGLDGIIARLKDCEGVFVSRIGSGAAQLVAQRGLRVFEAPYAIEDVLDKLVAEDTLGERKLK